MRNVLMGMLILMTMVAVTYGAVIRDVSVTATDEYTNLYDPYSLGVVNGEPNAIVNGSGFEEKLGWHYNDGLRGTVQEEESPYDVFMNGAGTMWIASMDIDGQGTKPSVTFDLGTAQTLTEIKVWNANSTGNTVIAGLGDIETKSRVGRLNMGVKTMDVVLLADDGTTVLDTFSNVPLDKAEGHDDVDFGEILQGITETNNVRYVRFDIKENYGDAAGQVGLSEVRFYNDIAVDVDAGSDQDVTIGSGDPDVAVSLDGTVSGSTDVTWSLLPRAAVFPKDLSDPNIPNIQDPNVVIISDVNAIDTTAVIKMPGIYQFELTDNTTGVYDVVKVRVFASTSDDGLIGHWKLDGDLTDASDGAHDGSFTGTPAPVLVADQGVTGIGDDAILYDRSGAIEVSDPEIIGGDYYRYFASQQKKEMTISLWCKFQGTFPTDQQTMGLFDKGAFSAFLVGDAIHFSANLGEIYAGTRFVYHGVGSTKVTDGSWHFVVLTYNGFSVKLYVDGHLDSEVFTYDRTEFFDPEGEQMFNIGGRSGSDDLSFVGLIDDVKLYRVAKDQTWAVDEYESAGFVACTTPLMSDLDGDCHVNINDLMLFAQDWLK